MAAEFEDLTLRMLREIRDDMKIVKDDVAGLNRRTTSLERGIGELKVDLAETHHRLDGFGSRLQRIERRLDLVEEPMLREAQSKFEGLRDD